MTDNEQFLSVGDLERIINLMRVLNETMTPVHTIGRPLSERSEISPEDIVISDSNGEPVGRIAWNGDTKQYVLVYPAPPLS